MGSPLRHDSQNELTFTADPGILFETTLGGCAMSEIVIVALLSVTSILSVVSAKQFVTEPATPDADVQLFH